MYVKQPMPPMKVTRRGRFRKVLRYRDGSIRGRVEVSGRLKGKRVKVQLSGDYGHQRR